MLILIIVDFDEDLLEEAIELLNSLEYAVRCERIMILLNDAIRVKSIKSLSKVITHHVITINTNILSI